ncbi:MAG: hypothetical protein AB7E61_06900 [Acholeplasmataceae bacterium]
MKKLLYIGAFLLLIFTLSTCQERSVDDTPNLTPQSGDSLIDQISNQIKDVFKD